MEEDQVANDLSLEKHVSRELSPEAHSHGYFNTEDLKALSKISVEDVEALKDITAQKRTFKIFGGVAATILSAAIAWNVSLSGKVTELEALKQNHETKIVNLETQVGELSRNTAANFLLDAGQQQVLVNLTAQLSRIEEKLDRVIEGRTK